MPRAPFFIGIAILFRVASNGEEFIGRFVAVPQFAGSHGGITGSMKDRWNGLLLQLWWAEFLLERTGAVGKCQTVRPHMIMWREGEQTAPT